MNSSHIITMLLIIAVNIVIQPTPVLRDIISRDSRQKFCGETKTNLKTKYVKALNIFVSRFVFVSPSKVKYD